MVSPQEVGHTKRYCSWYATRKDLENKEVFPEGMMGRKMERNIREAVALIDPYPEDEIIVRLSIEVRNPHDQ